MKNGSPVSTPLCLGVHPFRARYLKQRGGPGGQTWLCPWCDWRALHPFPERPDPWKNGEEWRALLATEKARKEEGDAAPSTEAAK